MRLMLTLIAFSSLFNEVRDCALDLSVEWRLLSNVFEIVAIDDLNHFGPKAQSLFREHE